MQGLKALLRLKKREENVPSDKKPKQKKKKIKKELFKLDTVEQQKYLEEPANEDLEFEDTQEPCSLKDGADEQHFVTGVKLGTFVLVKFVVRNNPLYYAGYIISEMNSDEQFEIKFLRRMPSKTPSTNKIRFFYPENDDFKFVRKERIVLSFSNPQCKPASSKRQSSMIILEHEKLGEFQPVY